MLTTQDENNLCFQRVARALGNLVKSMIWELQHLERKESLVIVTFVGTDLQQNMT